MKPLVIICASGFAKEAAFLAQRLGRNVLGFLDDTPEKQGTKVQALPVLGTIDQWTEYPDAEFVVAIGSPRGRQSIVARMCEGNNQPNFATLIDPSVIKGDDVTIGKGSIICAGVILTVNIQLGDHVILNINTTVGHDTQIDNFVTVAPLVAVSGNIHLGDLVEVGTGAALREKLTVGAGAVVGMGSVLTKSVDERNVVVGNPAKVFRTLEA